MGLLTCDYCGLSVYGFFKLHDHKAKDHPLENAYEHLVRIKHVMERLTKQKAYYEKIARGKEV